MAKLGFIGASGLMGHGMAKNLLAKGHALAITVHRRREPIADLLAAGAVEAPSPAALAASCDHPHDGAREGAKFIADHIIRVSERAFDDFAGGGADQAANKKMLRIA